MERGPRQAVDPMSRLGTKRVSFKESRGASTKEINGARSIPARMMNKAALLSRTLFIVTVMLAIDTSVGPDSVDGRSIWIS